MSPRKLSPLTQLMDAMQAFAFAKGEAQWTNGYRTAKAAPDLSFDDSDEGKRLREKESRQFEYADAKRGDFRRLAVKLLRSSRQSPTPTKPKAARRGRKEGRNG